MAATEADGQSYGEELVEEARPHVTQDLVERMEDIQLGEELEDFSRAARVALEEWMEKRRTLKAEVKKKEAEVEKDEAEKHRTEAAVKASSQEWRTYCICRGGDAP
ncbi:unnamed protein product [Cladocopium goreaui]|uniref:Uncharacterized protein n=1 Tax=Cladocopium goreaui TaxID=2562237 RepID=A0A9P1BWM3_9DINO|nr:unnamed protein product [Cladocopium goreaui]